MAKILETSLEITEKAIEKANSQGWIGACRITPG